MTSNSGSFLVVEKTKMAHHQTLALSGLGTPGSKTAVRCALALAGCGVADELIGVILQDWHQEVQDLARLLPRQVFRQHPSAGIPGLPMGFRNQPDLAESTRQHWEPQVEAYWKELRRRSSKHGVSCGAVIHPVTPAGGHTPITRFSVERALEAFPNSLHLAIYYLPSDDRGIWKNLREYDSYPDDLGIPIILCDNRYRKRIDKAIPDLLSVLIAGPRYTDKGQRMYADNFTNVSNRAPVLGLATADVQLPIVPIPFYKRWAGVVPGVAEQEVPPRLAQLLVQVLQPSAKLVDCADPDLDEVQFIGLGGFPIPKEGERWLQTSEEYRRRVIGMAQDVMEERDQPWPSGLSTVWSSTVDHIPQEYVRIPAVRVFPIKGMRVRDFIDRMLENEQAPPPPQPLLALPLH